MLGFLKFKIDIFLYINNLVKMLCYFCDYTIDEIKSYIGKSYDYNINETVQMGHLECLKKIEKKRVAEMKNICEVAASHRQLECLKYLVEFCHTSSRLYYFVIFGGSIECLRFLLEYPKCKNIVPDDLCYMVTQVKNDRIDILRYLYRKKFIINKKVVFGAIMKQNMRCFKFALKKTISRSENLCTSASLTNNLSIIRYVRRKGYEWNESYLEHTLRNRQYRLFWYGLKNKCEWNKNKCLKDELKNGLCFEKLLKYINWTLEF
jgi:hypothetical protein